MALRRLLISSTDRLLSIAEELATALKIEALLTEFFIVLCFFVVDVDINKPRGLNTLYQKLLSTGKTKNMNAQINSY